METDNIAAAVDSASECIC